MLSALEHRSTASAGEHHRPAPWRGSVVHDARPACSIMRRTRSGRADRRSNWRRVAPRSSAAGSVAPSRSEREPSRRRSPQPPAASRQPYSRTAVSRQLAVAVAAAAAAAVSELLRRVADAVWTRAAQRRASVLGVGSARARADGACKQTAISPLIQKWGTSTSHPGLGFRYLFSDFECSRPSEALERRFAAP